MNCHPKMKQRLLSAFLFVTLFASAQDFSNKGKDFWVGYGLHCRMYTGSNLQDMKLYFATEKITTITVSVPGLGYAQTYSNIPANTIFETPALPKAGTYDARLLTEGISNRGIHIQSDAPVVAYAHIYNNNVSGATLLFPTNTLGKEYYSINFQQYSNESHSNSFVYVIAADTGTTTVEVKPSANTQTMIAGNTYSYTLTQGQVLNILGTETYSSNIQQGVDLTGTTIKSVSTNGAACKRIAVFSGSGKIGIKCPLGPSNASADNYMVQSFPKNAWGRNYLTVPTAGFANNFFRICVQDPITIVKLNGAVLTGLINNFYYQINAPSGASNTPNFIEADKPVMVAQYITSQGQCGNGSPGDPEVIYLSPVEQTIDKVILNSTGNYAITKHYINVITKTSNISSFKLDGISQAASFVVHPANPAYSYALLGVAQVLTPGIHTLTSDSGFTAIAYGYGQAESYGYNAGTNVRDLYQYITVQNEYASVNFPATCRGTPFHFSITLPYQATSLVWNFNNNPSLSPNATISLNNPVPDSFFVRDGRTLYVYKVPGIYIFSAAGTYNIKVFANNPTPDGCSGEQEISYDVVVYEKPKADFVFAHTGCVTDAVQFTDASNGNGRTIINWNWNFDDATASVARNPVKAFASADTFNVKLVAYTDIGCVSDTAIKPVITTTVPLAKFGTDSRRCAGDTLVFTDTSAIAVGKIVKWYWDFGNGNTLAESSNSPVKNAYPAAGSYNVILQVESNSGCKSTVLQKTIVIAPYPVADFSFPDVICLPAGTAQFYDLSTISDGTQSQFSYQWNFGDGGTSTEKNPVHHFSTVQPFNVQLTVTSNAGCSHNITKTAATIYPQVHADFNVNAEVCLRDSTPFTDFTKGNGVKIVKWRWNFGDGTTDTVQHPKHLYLLAGSYNVKLHVFTEKGCVSDTTLKPTLVHPLPTPSFVIANPICETRSVSFTSTSLANAGTVSNVYWDFGDGSTSYGSSATATHTYAAAGTYPLRLAVQSSKGCESDTLPGSIVVHHQPVAAFIAPEVCLNDAFALFIDSSYISGNTANLFTYQWNFGDANAIPLNPNTATQKNPTHKYTAVGTYTAWLKVTSVHGCTDSVAKTFFVNGSFPVAAFDVDNSAPLCSNTKVKIKNKSTVMPGVITKVEIYWDWGVNNSIKDVDENPAFDKVYEHLYPNFQSPLTKTFQIRFLAYSGTVCVNDKIKSVIVHASPQTQFITVPGICLDAAPLQITQASETTGIPGNFFFSGDGISASGLFTPIDAGVGTDTLYYVYVSTAGCRDSAKNTITVWPLPVAKFGVSSPLCEKNTAAFTDSSIANFSSIIKWKYTFGDGRDTLVNNTNPVTHIYNLSGNYSSTLVVTTDSGCVSNPYAVNLKINHLPEVEFNLPTGICLPGGNGTFTDRSTIPDGTASLFSYYWHFDDANNSDPSTQKNPTHQFSAVGTYNVKLRVTSSEGCIDSLSKPFSNIYPQPKANFGFSPREVCLGDPFTFTDSSNGNGGEVKKWRWNFGDGSATVTTQNPSKNFTDDSIYNVSLFIFTDKGCVSDTVTKPVTVHPYPEVSAGPDLFVLEGGYSIIRPNVAGEDLQYKWTDNSSGFLNNDTAKNPVFTPGNDIMYTLTVTARGGCSASDDVFIKVLRKPVIPNAFSPNRDGINDTWLIEHLDTYPGCTIEVFNRMGQRVFYAVGYITPWNGTVNGKELPVGTYYYVINPKNGRSPITGYVVILK